MQYVLREFQIGDPHDAELLAAMWNASDHAWPGGWTHGIPETAERIFEHTQKTDRIAIFVIEVDSEIVGYGDMMQEHGRDDVACLALLNVRPDFHGKGLGKALILKILEHTTERGQKQLTLGTWPGNLKAVPLYKKTGFFWVPETSVFMQNYIPTALTMPIAKPFFARHDWYRSFQRELEVAPDDIEWNGIKVFPYHFEEDGDRFTMWIDRQSEMPTAVETNDFYAACIVGKEDVICGLEQTTRWEVVNKRWSEKRREPLQVTLMAEGEEGIGLNVVESFEVEDRLIIEKSFTVSPNIKRKEPGLPAHQIKSTLIINGTPLMLGTAVKPVQPVEIQFFGQTVVPGKPNEKVVVKLRSKLDFPAQGELLIDPHPLLHFDKLSAPFTLEPQSWTSCTFYLHTNEVGAFQTKMKAAITQTNDLPSQLVTKSSPVTFRSIPLDSVFAWHDEEREAITIESPTMWVRAELRGGSMAVHERISGKQTCWQSAPELGPPFITWRSVSPVYAHRLEQRDGKVSLTLIMPSDTASGVTIEKTIIVGAGNFIRVDHRIINTTNAPQKFKLRCNGWSGLRAKMTLPLKNGLLHEPTGGWGDFPLGDPDLSHKPEDYAESWLATEGSGLVFGMVWGDCEEREEFTLQFDVPKIPPQSHHDIEPIYLVTARGNWEVVRQLWRWLKQPSTVREDHRPTAYPLLNAGFKPTPLLITQSETNARIVVHNRRGKALNGGWRISDCGLQVEPNAGELSGVKNDSPFIRDVTITVEDLTPRIETPRFSVTDDVTTRDFVSPAIILGDIGQSITTTQTSDQATLHLDNGLLSFTAAPAFLGSVTALRRGDVNHLHSAYPEAHPHSWMNPWFGGIHPFLGWISDERFLKEQFRGKPVERCGKRGIVWRGVKVMSDLQHKDNRWLRMEVEYLTIGGSNVIALLQRLINKTDAPCGAQGGMCVWLAVGGDVADNVLHYEQDRPRYGHAASTDDQVRTLRHRRRSDYSFQTRSNRWAAVENPQTGDVLAIVASYPNAWVMADDHGKEGVGIQIGLGVNLEPKETKEMVGWLAICSSVQEAQEYRALSEIWELP